MFSTAPTILQWRPAGTTKRARTRGVAKSRASAFSSGPRAVASAMDFRVDLPYAAAKERFAALLALPRACAVTDREFELAPGAPSWKSGLPRAVAADLETRVLACVRDPSEANLEACSAAVLEAFCFESYNEFTLEMLDGVSGTVRVKGERPGTNAARETAAWLRLEREPLLRALGVRLRAQRLHLLAQYHGGAAAAPDRDLVERLARLADERARRAHRVAVQRRRDEMFAPSFEACVLRDFGEQRVRYTRDGDSVLTRAAVIDSQSGEVLASFDRAEIVLRLQRTLERMYVDELRAGICGKEELVVLREPSGLVCCCYYENPGTKERVYDRSKPTTEAADIESYRSRCPWVQAALAGGRAQF